MIAGSVFGADAANDLLLTQRNSGNTGNTQRNITATTNTLLGWNGTTIGNISAGSGITIIGGVISSTASGTGTVTTIPDGNTNGVSWSVATRTTTPTFTFTLGAITPSSVNGNTVTTGTGTLTLGASKTLTASNTLTLTGTDGSSVNFGTGGTVLYSGGSYVASITGTANQVIASGSTGAVTLSTPQNIGTTNSPTFGGLTLNGTLTSSASGGGVTFISNSGSASLGTIFAWKSQGSDLGYLGNSDQISGGSINDIELKSVLGKIILTSVTAGSDTTDSSSSVTGAWHTAGGMGVAKKLFVGTDFRASGIISAGSGPTTLTDSAGKILAAALNTVGVAQGGTGVVTLTAYAPIFGGTTGTGAVQSGTVGTIGQVLTSNGAGALPTFQAAASGSTSWGSTTAVTDVASATTTDLGAVTSAAIRVTGTTTITGFGTVAAGTLRKGYFAGVLTLTYNATSMILPGAANITTVAGDRFIALSLGSGNWIVDYDRNDGTPLGVGNLVYATNAGAVTFLNMPVTSAATIGTEESYNFKINSSSVFKVYAESDGAGGLQNTGVYVNNAPLNQIFETVAAGTAYTMTTSYATLDFGTTDPTVILTSPGTYLVTAWFQSTLVSATTTTQAVSGKVRRTNNTAADVGSEDIEPLPVATATSESGPSATVISFKYTTINGNDVLELQGKLSASLGAGTVTATAARIIAVRQY